MALAALISHCSAQRAAEVPTPNCAPNARPSPRVAGAPGTGREAASRRERVAHMPRRRVLPAWRWSLRQHPLPTASQAASETWSSPGRTDLRQTDNTFHRQARHRQKPAPAFELLRQATPIGHRSRPRNLAQNTMQTDTRLAQTMPPHQAVNCFSHKPLPVIP